MNKEAYVKNSLKFNNKLQNSGQQPTSSEADDWEMALPQDDDETSMSELFFKHRKQLQELQKLRQEVSAKSKKGSNPEINKVPLTSSIGGGMDFVATNAPNIQGFVQRSESHNIFAKPNFSSPIVNKEPFNAKSPKFNSKHKASESNFHLKVQQTH